MSKVDNKTKSRILTNGVLYAECGAAKVLEHLVHGERSNVAFSAAPTTPWYAVVLNDEVLQSITDPGAAVMMANLVNAGYQAGVSKATQNAVEVIINSPLGDFSSFADMISKRLGVDRNAGKKNGPNLEPAKNAIRKDNPKGGKSLSEETKSESPKDQPKGQHTGPHSATKSVGKGNNDGSVQA